MTAPRPTWEERDLPVLRAILEEVEENGPDYAPPHTIARRTGFDAKTVERSLTALDRAQPPFFDRMVWVDDHDPTEVFNPTERARRAVGLWPTPDDLADRFIAAYENAVAVAETEAQRNAGRHVLAGLSTVGRGVLVEVFSRVVTSAL